MAKRQYKFANILNEYGKYVHLPIQKEIIYQSNYNNLAQEVYKKLGGVMEKYPINFGSFDIETDSCYIELDEEQHFTRYRRITLDAPFYNHHHSYFPVNVYKQLCENRENKVSKSKGFWTNKSCEKQFGESSINGDLSNKGSARWKQRAFNDFLKDIYCLVQRKPVYRFSVYESVIKDISLDKILKQNDKLSKELFEFVMSRIK